MNELHKLIECGIRFETQDSRRKIKDFVLTSVFSGERDMKTKKYWFPAAGVLIILLGLQLVGAGDSSEKAACSKLAVLWSSGDADVAKNVCFMYTHAAKKAKWFDEVKLIVWGPSARLLVGDKGLQDEVKQMIASGVTVQACVVCADRYGASEQLRTLGIEVRGMGRPLTEMLKSDWKVLTF